VITLLLGGVLVLSANPHRAFSITAEEVMQKALERAAHRDTAPHSSAYVYSKVMVTEELDTSGKVKNREEKVYDVVFDSGATTQTAAGKHFVERILARVSGTVWIDAEDYEIARADLRLNSSVDVFGGVLGSLKKMAVSLIRSRLPDGQWLSTGSTGDFQGRKL